MQRTAVPSAEREAAAPLWEHQGAAASSMSARQTRQPGRTGTSPTTRAWLPGLCLLEFSEGKRRQRQRRTFPRRTRRLVQNQLDRAAALIETVGTALAGGILMLPLFQRRNQLQDAFLPVSEHHQRVVRRCLAGCGLSFARRSQRNDSRVGYDAVRSKAAISSTATSGRLPDPKSAIHRMSWRWSSALVTRAYSPSPYSLAWRIT